MDKNIGKKLDGRYEITELIGIGGMADVYKAVDIMEDKVVAVKILKNEFSANEEFVRRFRNESKAIAVLSHPNIVKVYDVGFTDEMQFIVMEYIDGITLKEFIEQQGVLKWRDAVHFTVQILRALQHAHDKGIVHRDIKPQNIMLFSDGTIKVMDFGIARFARQDSNTLSEKTIGSVHYISPEQASGDITDEKSDIYSVGVMLYEMLTGRKPFDGDTPVAVALMHMQDPAVYPREIIDSIPEPLEEIVMHAMDKNPRKRYQSAAEMIKDIDTFKKNPGVVFGYINPDNKPKVADSGSTQFFTPVSATPETKKVVKKTRVVEEYDDDDDDYYDEPRKSYLIPILCAVTGVVVIVAALFIAIVIFDKMGDSTDTRGETTVPKLIGYNYQEAKEAFTDIVIEGTEEYNSEYPIGVIFEQDKAQGRTIKVGGTIKVKVSKGPKMVYVPDIINLPFTSASAALKNEDLLYIKQDKNHDDVPAGSVISVSPGVNTQVEAGSTVTVVVSIGPLSNDVEVPDVVGLTEEQAVAKLTAAKLSPIVEMTDVEEDAGKVLEQSIKEGEFVPRNSEITIYVSSGKIASREFVLQLPIPSDTSGSYDIDFYNTTGIKVIPTVTIDKTEYIANSFYNVTLTGSGEEETIIVEVTSNETRRPVEYARYVINFIEQTTPERIKYNIFAFRESLYGEGSGGVIIGSDSDSSGITVIIPA